MEGLRLNLVMDSDIIRVEIELRRAAVAAVVILSKLRGARATTLGTFDRFDMLGHPVAMLRGMFSLEGTYYAGGGWSSCYLKRLWISTQVSTLPSLEISQERE